MTAEISPIKSGRSCADADSGLTLTISLGTEHSELAGDGTGSALGTGKGSNGAGVADTGRGKC